MSASSDRISHGWIVIFLLSAAVRAEAAPKAGAQMNLAGYRARVSGEVLAYHSADPDVTQGLLVRSSDAKRMVEWETEAVPEKFDGEAASFVWLFGLDVNPEGHRFTLSVNGERWLEFANPATDVVRDWTVDGPKGATLRFRATTIDRFGDLMGYAVLRVPRALLTPGKLLRIAVHGESAGSPAWYITFQSAVQEGASAVVRPGLVRGKKGNYQSVVVTVVHLGTTEPVMVSTSFGEDEQWTMQLGGNRIELQHPEVKSEEKFTVRLRAGERELCKLVGRIAPVRHWTIDLVQHAHTDVGYTRPQTEILPEHLRYIDTALDYCDKTDGYPDDAKFRWTCEGAWAVREYLKSRTAEQIARLKKRAEEGRIEVTGMFLNMSEIIDEASYAAFLRPVRTFREAGLPVTTAMQDDVNGLAWCLADYFPKIGIDYVVMGQHNDRALVPFDKPTCFWWESPAGSRVLAYRPDHYHTGNFWGVHTGQVEPVENELLHYLAGLEKARYPFDRVAVQHSGYATDNSPPSTASSELVRKWNEKYVWPHLRCSLVREFPEWVRKNHAAELVVMRKAWTDWWNDGFGSAARETAAARVTQGRMNAVEGLLAMEAMSGIGPSRAIMSDAGTIRDDLIFWGEHTMGAAESIGAPLCENSEVQWMEKSAYAWDAVKREAMVGESALGRLRMMVGEAAGPRLAIVNTLGYPRSGVVRLFADHEQLPIDGTVRLLDEGGEEVPMQLESTREEGSYWAVNVRDVPAMGWRTLRVDVDQSVPRVELERPGKTVGTMENEFYRLKIDRETGAIASLFDKSAAMELVDGSAKWKLGQVIYETLGNREQISGYMLDHYARRSLDHVVIGQLEMRPLWNTIEVSGELPCSEGPAGVRCEVRLFNKEKRIELHYTIQQRRKFSPEGLYVAFPFGPKDGQVSYETLGGPVSLPGDILPGAASDWQAMQSYAAVRWATHQVMLSSNEAPLMMVGGMNLGKFQREMKVERPHIFGWVMNNYWTTNFRAGQEGEFSWSYALTSTTEKSATAAARFGWSNRVPMLARLLPGSAKPAASAAARPEQVGSGTISRVTGSMLDIDAPNVMLVAARPAADGRGVVLHLREVDGKGARVETKEWGYGGKEGIVAEVDVLERVVKEPVTAVEFAPYEVRFLMVRGR